MKVLTISSIILILNVFFIYSEDNNNRIVYTPKGSIRGTILKTRENRNIFSFRGIRYAEPPIGPNRFKPPVPVKSWMGIYDATADGPICPQVMKKRTVLMAEDCLILNVYSKNLTGNEPVLVYIHGGGFFSGSSHSKMKAGPQYLLDKDIVLVTFNYRLGLLGFMSTGTRSAPGNYGFKDQVEVLRWVRGNIRFFGGNSNLVTIAGNSSGALAVVLHLVSPLSRGLFHQAIVASKPGNLRSSSFNTVFTRDISEAIGCPWTLEMDITVNCLRNKSYEELVTISTKVLILHSALFKFMTWSYEIEDNFGNFEFLTESPLELFFRGDFAMVPLMTGFTKIESMMEAYDIFGNKTKRAYFEYDFEEIAARYFLYEGNVKCSKAINKSLWNFYFNKTGTKSFTIDHLENLLSDGLFSYGIHRLVSLTRKYVNVFYYRLDFKGRYSHCTTPDRKPCGFVHADELQYIFLYDFAPMFNKTDPENLMVERLTSWWTTFVKTGQPNDPNNKWTSTIYWPPTNSTSLRTLNIDVNCKQTDEPFQDRFTVWDRLFPIAYQNGSLNFDNC